MGLFSGLRNRIRQYLPWWMQGQQWRNVTYAHVRPMDIYLQQAVEGGQAAQPGLGTSTADTLTAQSRGLRQGPTEPAASFEARLRVWIQSAREYGGAAAMAQEIQAYLTGQGSLGTGVVPVVRIVDRRGNWTIANADGSITKTVAAFDWDESLGWDDGLVHQPGSAITGWWADQWIIIAPPSGSSPIYPYYTGTSDPVWIANFGASATLGGGFQIPIAVARDLLAIISDRKGAHMWVRGIIWPSDSTSFTPAAPTVDGTFGDWSKVVASHQVPARATGDARFMITAAGG